ncbi:hypothetical protein [Sandaracinus amylolyticus]|uniref:hypothetical protein n=1 Tax=Sandaracinus amylolyticus TaxID=927083 RepID=UPI001F288BAA|nr:hypothetical protein [Sandaracinus amylolyticus]UJR81476.1 Hypothetical protein I5071_35350 [Sandaracinus amylolyticus]
MSTLAEHIERDPAAVLEVFEDLARSARMGRLRRAGGGAYRECSWCEKSSCASDAWS